MANELKHGTVGTELTQAEWEAIGAHVVANQAVGDIIYADTTSQLLRLGIGSTNDVLRVTSGKPDWQATSFITALGTIATGVWQGTDVGVAYGGTGVSTLTDGGVLLGSGASAITAMAVLTDGQMIVGNGSTDPVAESGATLRTSIGVGTGDSPQFTDLTVSDDLTLNSDSAVINMGAGNDFTITHDGTTGATLAGNPITITSAGAATWSTSSGVLTIDGDDGIVMQTTGSGNVRINELVGIGAAASATKQVYISSALDTQDSNILNLSRTVTVTDDVSIQGVKQLQKIKKTSAVFAGKNIGHQIENGMEGGNNQNWTDSSQGGLLGYYSLFNMGSGAGAASGTIEKASNFYAYSTPGGYSSTTVIVHLREFYASGLGNGTATNRYGVYVADSGGIVTTEHGLYVEDLDQATNGYGVTIEGADTAALWIGSGADNTDAANGIFWGASKDLHMYRAGAHRLIVSSTNGSSAIQALATTGSPQFEMLSNASSGSNMNLVYKEGAGNGAANNKYYLLGYDGTNNRFRLYSGQAGGASSADDIWRIDDDQADIDAKDVWQDNQFDVYDDAKVLSPYRQGKMALAQRQKELIDMGVLRQYDDGWVGYNDQRMAALLAGGIYQTRERVDRQYDEIDKRLAKIEAELGV